MGIIRTEKRRNPFAQIDRRCLEDAGLSWKAKGLLAYLLSRPNDWSVYVKQLVDVSTDGKHATRSGIDELITARYVERNAVRNDAGQFQGYEYVVYEQPRDEGEGGATGTTDEPDAPADADTTKPRTETEEPESGKPENGSSESGKPATTNKELKNKEDTNKESNTVAPDKQEQPGACLSDVDAVSDETNDTDTAQGDTAQDVVAVEVVDERGQQRSYEGIHEREHTDGPDLPLIAHRMGEAFVERLIHLDAISKLAAKRIRRVGKAQVIEEAADVFRLAHQQDRHSWQEMISAMAWVLRKDCIWIKKGWIQSHTSLRKPTQNEDKTRMEAIINQATTDERSRTTQTGRRERSIS